MTAVVHAVDYPTTRHDCPVIACPKRGELTCALCDDCGPPKDAITSGVRECPCCGRMAKEAT